MQNSFCCIQHQVFPNSNFRSILVFPFRESSKQGVCCSKLAYYLKAPNKEYLMVQNPFRCIQHLFSQMVIFGQFWSFSLERVQNREFVAPNLPNISRYQIMSICWSRTQFFVSSTLFSQLAIFGQFWSLSLERVQNQDFVVRNLPNISR